MAGKKISQLTALGSTYAATDLFEISKDMGGGTYASRKITGSELTSSIGAGTVTSVGGTGTVNGLTLTGTVTTSGNLTLGGTLAINNGDWSGTDLSVANGGTGASTLTANGVLIGNGTSAITAVDMSTKGDILIGDGTGNPQMLSVGSDTYVLTADSTEATGVKWAAAGGGGATDLNGLTDAEIVASSGGSALQYNIFLTNGTSAGAATQHGTLSDARANLAIGPNALASLTQGDYNIAIGYQTLDAITTGLSNIAIGYAAGSTLSDTSANVHIGYACGISSTSAGSVGIGYDAIRSSHSGVDCVAIGKNAGYTMAAANDNTLIGMDAGKLISSGDGNTTLGFEAGDTISTGSNNTILGVSADAAATANYQIAIGGGMATTQASSLALGESGKMLLHGEFSTAGETSLGINLGNTWTAPQATLHVKAADDDINTIAFLIQDNADRVMTRFYDNGETIHIGRNAGYTDPDTLNIYLGSSAGFYPTGANNIAIGTNALAGASGAGASGNNVAIGWNAMKDNTDSRRNVCIGYDSGRNMETSDDNICLGYQAGDNLTTGDNNIIIGVGVDASSASVSNELRIGHDAVIPISADLSSGAVTINGAYTLPTAVTGSNDYVLTAQTDGTTAWAAASGGGASALGDLSDCTTPATDNYGIGTNAIDSITTGDYNIGIGLDAGTAITTSAMNVCIGRGAGAKISTGTGRNVCIGGYDAGGEITTQTDNVCIGYEAGAALTSSNNVAIGYGAGKANSTGGCNTFVGNNAGIGATGQQNVAIGYLAANSASFSGSYNVVLGRSEDLTSGAGNTILGVSYSVANITTGNYNTIVGHQALGAPTVSNQIAIGYKAEATAQYAIAIGDDVSAAGNDVVIGRSGNTITCDFDTDGTWTQSSDERKKNVIGASTLGLDFISALTPKTYTWKPAEDYPEAWGYFHYNDQGEKVYDQMNTTTVMYGLIAQEVKAALDAAGVSDFNGWSETPEGEQQISKTMFVIPLISAVKELKSQIDSLTARLEALENA